jgi:hypothetical protein
MLRRYAVEDSGIAAERTQVVNDDEKEKPSSKLTKPLDGYTGATGVECSLVKYQ